MTPAVISMFAGLTHAELGPPEGHGPWRAPVLTTLREVKHHHSFVPAASTPTGKAICRAEPSVLVC